MTFKVEFETDNAAFEGYEKRYEIARILAVIAKKVVNGEEPGAVVDINGNTVGTFTETEG